MRRREFITLRGGVADCGAGAAAGSAGDRGPAPALPQKMKSLATNPFGGIPLAIVRTVAASIVMTAAPLG